VLRTISSSESATSRLMGGISSLRTPIGHKTHFRNTNSYLNLVKLGVRVSKWPAFVLASGSIRVGTKLESKIRPNPNLNPNLNACRSSSHIIMFQLQLNN